MLESSPLPAFEDYDDHMKTLLASPQMPMSEFETQYRKEYPNIVSCLNIHELVAVGVYKNVLDRDVCYDFWGDELIHARRNAIRVIEHVRKDGGGTHAS
jgi:hypothetical protein